MLEQKYDSRLTSINSVQMPKTVKLIEGIVEKNQVWLDIGGGKFNNVVEHFKALGANLLVLDPYNRSGEHNEKVENYLQGNKVDGIMCNNVLNVIEEKEVRLHIIEQSFKYAKNNSCVFFLIYEGDGSGVGRITKQTSESISFQMNQKTQFYLDEIQSVFGDNVYKKGNFIIAKKELKLDLLEDLKKQAKKLGIKRDKGVGKNIGGNIYVHKMYKDSLPQEFLNKAIDLLEKSNKDFDYTIIKYNTKTGAFSFISSPDFDTSAEPIVSASICINKSGEIKKINEKKDPQIYHHKWLFVEDDYINFNVLQSIQRSIEWKSVLGENKEVSSKIGTLSYWLKWQENNLKINKNSQIIKKNNN